MRILVLVLVLVALLAACTPSSNATPSPTPTPQSKAIVTRKITNSTVYVVSYLIPGAGEQQRPVTGLCYKEAEIGKPLPDSCQVDPNPTPTPTSTRAPESNALGWSLSKSAPIGTAIVGVKRPNLPGSDKDRTFSITVKEIVRGYEAWIRIKPKLQRIPPPT